MVESVMIMQRKLGSTCRSVLRQESGWGASIPPHLRSAALSPGVILLRLRSPRDGDASWKGRHETSLNAR